MAFLAIPLSLIVIGGSATKMFSISHFFGKYWPNHMLGSPKRVGDPHRKYWICPQLPGQNCIHFLCCALGWYDWLKSYAVCTGAGAAGTVLLFSLQVPLGLISSYIERKHPNHRILKIIYEDCVYVIVLATMLLLWRGCYNLNATYMIVDPLLGGVVNMLGGLFVLISLRVLSTVSACEWALDGEGSDGEAFFPTWYTYMYKYSSNKALTKT